MLTVITGMRRPARPPVRRLRSPRSAAAIDNLFVPQLAPRTAAPCAFSLTLLVTQGDAVELRERPRVTGLLAVTIGRWPRCLSIQHPGRQATASCPTCRALRGRSGRSLHPARSECLYGIVG